MRSSYFPRPGAAWAVLGLLLALPAVAGVNDPFPELRPDTRARAIELLRSRFATGTACLTPATQALALSAEQPPALRRAYRLLQAPMPSTADGVLEVSPGVVVRYGTEPRGIDSVDLSDTDGDGFPDVVQAVALGLAQARLLLVDELELSPPATLSVRLVELGSDVDGYLAPGSTAAGVTAVLDGTPRHGLDGARRAAIHQFAHAVLLPGTATGHDWSEAFATWAVLRIEGKPDPETAALLGDRLAEADRGLASSVPRLIAGDALWLAFVDEAYGAGAVRATLDDLAVPGLSVAAALDHALRRTSAHDLAAAFREFQLWTLLTGDRADGHHFSFADLLPSPRFAATQDGLPALSVQAEPALGPLGAAQIRFVPDEERGGLQVAFEGALGGAWEADLILFADAGTVRRIPLGLDADGRGELTVPVDGLAEAVLLVRHLDGNGGGSERYTYSACSDSSFPFVLGTVEARPTPDGVLVSWETVSESRLVGFNVLRQRDENSAATAVNPVWVPALGASKLTTTYHFMDATARPGVSYLYRIQGITGEGLSGSSDPIPFRPASPAR